MRATTNSALSDLRIFYSTGRDDTNSILVTGLPGDEGFEPTDNCYFRTAASLRWEVNRLIREKAHACGLGHRLVNTEKYIGTTGWTFYGQGQAASVRSIALALAAHFQVDLLDKST